jgi:hypothetical protein
MTASFHQEGRFGPIYKTSLITPLFIEMPVPSQECKRHVFYVSTIIGLDFKIVPTPCLLHSWLGTGISIKSGVIKLVL